jgi:hypothetical protein
MLPMRPAVGAGPEPGWGVLITVEYFASGLWTMVTSVDGGIQERRPWHWDQVSHPDRWCPGHTAIRPAPSRVCLITGGTAARGLLLPEGGVSTGLERDLDSKRGLVAIQSGAIPPDRGRT